MRPYIYVYSIRTADQLLDIMPKIESFVTNANTQLPVKPIVTDSIAALFRSEFENTPRELKRRSSLLFKISGKLMALATRFCLTVVVTIQVVDFMGPSEAMNGVKFGNLGGFVFIWQTSLCCTGAGTGQLCEFKAVPVQG